MSSVEKKTKPKRLPRVANSFTMPEINAMLTALERDAHTVVGRSEPALNARRKLMRMRNKLNYLSMRDFPIPGKGPEPEEPKNG